MRITIHSGDWLVASEAGDPGLDVDTADDGVQLGAVELLATSLAVCTASTLTSYASTLAVSAHDLELEVRWTLADAPHRVGGFDLAIHWPSLPASRRRAAERAAETCTIHQTLTHPPRVRVAAPDQSSEGGSNGDGSPTDITHS